MTHGSPRLFTLFLTATVLLTAVLGLGSRAEATLFARVADQDLAAAAEVIVEAVVLEVDDTVVTAPPSTDVRVEVTDVVKGFVPGSVLRLAVPGGRDASGMELRVYGTPRFLPGARVLLFLRAAADGTYRVLHLSQGVFHLAQSAEPGESQTLAWRDFGEAVEVELEGRPALEPEKPRDLERFKDWLAAGARPLEADYLVDVEAAVQARWREKFTLFEQGGFNPRWRDFDDGGSVRWLAHQAGQPGISDGGFGDFQTALAAWNDDPGSLIHMTYGGTTTSTMGLRSFDNFNTIVFDNLDGAGSFDEDFDCSRGGVIAQGGPWISTNQHSHGGRMFRTIVAADIVTNKGIECWIGVQKRAPEVFAHELGHALGIAHSCGDNAAGPCTDAVKNEALMRAQAHGDGRGADLRADDRAAAAFLYADPNAPTAPASPSGLNAAFGLGGEVVLAWADNSDNETGFRIERRIGAGGFGEIATVGEDAVVYSDLSPLPPATTVSYRVRSFNSFGESAPTAVASVTTPAGEPAVCVAGPQTLCLNRGRFQVEVDWRNSSNQRGVGTVVDLGVTSDDSGLFWFFDPDNWELLVKVLDGCAVTGHYWVFAAATTDVEFTLRVTDTQSGQVSSYRNRLGVAAPAITDTAAFATCP